MISFSLPTRGQFLVWISHPVFFFICAIVAFSIRIWLSTFGHNYDFDSYVLVTDLMQQGKNVYAETCRYNYAPLWMWILYALRFVFTVNFRIAVSAFVSLVDIMIAGVLYQRNNKPAAFLILFSPVCMIISGFHNQFDNLSILVALLAVRYVEGIPGYNYKIKNWGLGIKQTFLLAILIGLSLLAKHVLIFLPSWFLLHKQLSMRQKTILLIVPYLIFLGSFLPYLPGKDGILNNVIFYNPGMNAPFYNLVIPKPIMDLILRIAPYPFKAVFFFLLIGAGFFMRKKPLSTMLLLYYLFVVMLSSMLSVQYLVIPMVSLALYESRFWKWYNIVGGIFLVMHPHGLNMCTMLGGAKLAIGTFILEYGYYLLVSILLFAVIDLSWPGLLHKKTLIGVLKPYL